MAHEQVHRWRLNGTVVEGGIEFFAYLCGSCGSQVYASQPFSAAGLVNSEGKVTCPPS